MAQTGNPIRPLLSTIRQLRASLARCSTNCARTCEIFLSIPEQAQRGLRSCDTEASHGLIAYSNVSAEIGQSGCVRRHPCLASSRAVLALSQAYLNKGCTTLHPKQNSLASLCQIKMSKRLNTASIDLITTHFRPTSTQRATALVARCTPTTSCPDPASCTQC